MQKTHPPPPPPPPIMNPIAPLGKLGDCYGFPFFGSFRGSGYTMLVRGIQNHNIGNIGDYQGLGFRVVLHYIQLLFGSATPTPK